MRFLFVDQIVQLDRGKSIRGIKHVTANDYYLTQDAHGRACFMPSLIGETLGQLAAWNVMESNNFTARPVAGITAKATLKRPAFVGETILLESFIDKLDDKAVQYNSVASIAGDVIFSIEGALGPVLPMSDFIAEADVREQFAEINRPGVWPPPLAASTVYDTQEFAPAFPAMQFDRLLAHEPGVSMVVQKNVTRAAPYFPDHFPKKPVLPLTVLLECKLNLAQTFIKDAPFDGQYVVEAFRKIKMNNFVSPGDVITTQVKVKSCDGNCLILSFRSEVNGARVCVLEVVMNKVVKNGK